jgi:GDPmannose 4,6-dehydratase
MVSKKTAIVTGATGQTGSYMCELLLSIGYTVIAATRRTSQAIHSNLDRCFELDKDARKRGVGPLFYIREFDLNDPHSIESLVRHYQPELFINLGAQTFVADSWNSPVNHFNCNALGVLHCLESIRKHSPDTKFYNAGSSEEFGDVVESPQNEDHPLRPRSPYGAAKAAARHLVKVYRESYDLYAVQGILFNHESPRRQDYFVTRKITSHLAKMKLGLTEEPLELGNLEARRDWTDARDMVKGIWLMLNQDKPKDYVLASGKTRSVEEFVNAALLKLGDIVYPGRQGIANWRRELNWRGKGLDRRLTALEDDKNKPVNGVVLDTLYMKEGRVFVKVNPEFFRPAEVDILHGDPTRAEKELGWKREIPFEQMVADMVEEDLKQWK